MTGLAMRPGQLAYKIKKNNAQNGNRLSDSANPASVGLFQFSISMPTAGRAVKPRRHKAWAIDQPALAIGVVTDPPPSGFMV